MPVRAMRGPRGAWSGRLPVVVSEGRRWSVAFSSCRMMGRFVSEQRPHRRWKMEIDSHRAVGVKLSLDITPKSVSDLAGLFRGDTTLMDICEEAYRLRDQERGETGIRASPAVNGQETMHIAICFMGQARIAAGS